MRISDWSSDVCSSDLARSAPGRSSGSPGYAGRGSGRRPSTTAGTAATQRCTGKARRHGDRKSVVEGKSVSVRVDLGGGRRIKKKQKKYSVKRKAEEHIYSH